jgi:hypothetical protein
MKTSKHRPMALSLRDSVREREAQQEIENFRKALSSYPDHFARDPGLSFEEHLFSLAEQTDRKETADAGRKPAGLSRQLAAHA